MWLGGCGDAGCAICRGIRAGQAGRITVGTDLVLNDHAVGAGEHTITIVECSIGGTRRTVSGQDATGSTNRVTGLTNIGQIVLDRYVGWTASQATRQIQVSACNAA